jgi:uncharacterized protein YdhG (YjbR/CyaY superfamily)
MARPEFQSVDDYIAAQPESARAVLERVRATIRKALPRATEGISYSIPVYRVDGRMVLYFAGFKNHYSLYPATSQLVRTLRKELGAALYSKATIRFALDEAVPTRLIARIARLRAAEVAEPASKARRNVKKRSTRRVSRR